MSDKTPDIIKEDRRRERRKSFLRYVIVTGILLAIIFLWIFLGGGFSDGKRKLERMKLWSDAFFVVGGFTFCLGMLLWASGEGSFDMIGYAISTFFGTKYAGKHETYLEYKERKHDRRTDVCRYVIIPAILLVAVAAAFAVAFEHV
ncbi:MAG: DUF3899 domain-containing protein [Lachnospiraceae bacterium]|nr:DUF3899 domain-containing protein [Lachnospiraceae bacterium]